MILSFSIKNLVKQFSQTEEKLTLFLLSSPFLKPQLIIISKCHTIKNAH